MKYINKEPVCPHCVHFRRNYRGYCIAVHQHGKKTKYIYAYGSKRRCSCFKPREGDK